MEFKLGSSSIGEKKFRDHVMVSLTAHALLWMSKFYPISTYHDDNANFNPFNTHIAINRYAIPCPPILLFLLF